MFGDLPKIFERNFVVGYVLPSALFLLLSLGFTHNGNLWDFLTTSDGASFAVVAFALGIMLLALNRSITRILEGYGKLNPARLMIWLQRWRFKRLREKLKAANKEYHRYSKPEDVPEELEQRRQRLMTRLVERYPNEKGLVLSTSFGNCLRAFESYPNVMYKLEIIEGWTRLAAVIPKDYSDQIDTAKAQTDLWVNLWFLSLLTIGDAILTWRFPGALLAGSKRQLVEKLLDKLVTFANAHGHLSVTLNATDIAPYFQPLLTSVGALALAFFASSMAARAAIEYGSTFKAAVDVYLPALYTQLGFPAAANWEDVRNRWDRFSDAVSYRRADLMRDARSPSPIENPPTTAAITEAASAKPVAAPVKRLDPIAYLNAKASSLLARAKAKMSQLRKDVTVTQAAEQKRPATASNQNNGVAGQSTPPPMPARHDATPSSEKPDDET